MNTTLEKPSVLVTASELPMKLKLRQFWEKWGIWLLILGGLLLLFSFTDFSDFTKGMREGYANGRGKGPPSGKGWLAGILVALFGFVVIIGLLSGISHLYYVVFHKHVFKKNQIAYTILYIICLLLIWNILSEGFYKLLESNKEAEDKIKRSELNEMSGSVLASLILIYMVIYGFITDFRKNRKLQLALIQQRTQAELDALKAQVNPHFLFNSLNNIYGTAILEDSPRTAESIQQLSGIVRYVMEESRLRTTTIERELRFIDDYVELQRIRLPTQSNIDIQTRIEWDEKPAQIVPLLLNPLIENAFKYGISIQHPCFVHVYLKVLDGVLQLKTENSILPRTDLEKGTGLGLANVRQRLDLAYPNQHSLRITEEVNTYSVDLTIKL